MVNVYAVKYVAVSEIEGQRVSKNGTVNVLAETPQEAGSFAESHLKTDGVVEVNIHLAHEVAKDVKVPTPPMLVMPVGYAPGEEELRNRGIILTKPHGLPVSISPVAAANDDDGN